MNLPLWENSGGYSYTKTTLTYTMYMYVNVHIHVHVQYVERICFIINIIPKTTCARSNANLA